MFGDCCCCVLSARQGSDLNTLDFTSVIAVYNEELRDLLVDNSNNHGGGVHNSSLTGQHHKLDIMEGMDGTFCR